MPNERLPVNIFPGVLPGSYNFLDDGSDPSKWSNSTLGLPPFTSQDTGEAYGYYGKGMRLLVTGAPDLICRTQRTFLASGNGSYQCGFTVRPGPGAFRAYTWNDDPPGALGRAMMVGFYFPNFTTNQGYLAQLILNTREVSNFAPPSGRGFLKVSYSNGLGTIWDTPLVATVNYYDSATLVDTPERIPWIRVTAYIEQLVLKRIDVNGMAFPVSMPLGVFGAQGNSRCEIWGSKNDIVAGDVYWDFDQVWASETENIV